jgi:hypothetical protein
VSTHPQGSFYTLVVNLSGFSPSLSKKFRDFLQTIEVAVRKSGLNEVRLDLVPLSGDVMVALPGEYGTSSEVHLAIRYRTPVIMFATSRNAIPDIPEDVHWTRSLGEVQQFVQTHTAG